MESNDIPEIPDRGETSDIPGLPSGEAKENWIGEQCTETEENLRKNNSKRVSSLVF